MTRFLYIAISYTDFVNDSMKGTSVKQDRHFRATCLQSSVWMVFCIASWHIILGFCLLAFDLHCLLTCVFASFFFFFFFCFALLCLLFWRSNRNFFYLFSSIWTIVLLTTNVDSLL